MIFINKWDYKNKIKYGLNYRRDDGSIIELVIRIPLLIKKTGRWIDKDALWLVEGERILNFQIYFRIRKNIKYLPLFVFDYDLFLTPIKKNELLSRKEIDDTLHLKMDWEKDRETIKRVLNIDLLLNSKTSHLNLFN